MEGLSHIEKSVCFSVGSVCMHAHVLGGNALEKKEKYFKIYPYSLWNFVDVTQSIWKIISHVAFGKGAIDFK